MKTVILARAPDGKLGEAWPGFLSCRPWAAQASRIAVQVGMPSTPAPAEAPEPPLYDAVIELWSDTPLPLAADRELAARALLDIRASQELVAKGTAPAVVGVTPGLSQLSFIAALPGLAPAEYLRHWGEHIPLATAIHVGMDRYVQDRLSAGEAGWFGMAHLHFPDDAALRDGLFRSAEDVAVITDDVAEFVGEYATMLAIEHVVKS
ncbi:hypothetical protein GCM10011494_21750 [Novosphingobium endophyticum]|uniref:EthD domain-containing protein n=1 Tax=Novosphingobium endophyticum TaxID=1955250 RepID=A0A916TSK7_9SPHN|nr:EthD domain-containing protein [Novosphingobium endophyticum]GGC02889.1 hypothetical protein GCM10011494_21750 [Novosphingobium endophyticum]